MVETKSPAGPSGPVSTFDIRSSDMCTMTTCSAAESKSNLDGVVGCVNALFTTLEVFGLRKEARDRDAASTVKHWHRAADAIGAGGWMKWAKYKFAAFFFIHTRQLDACVPSPLPKFVDSPRILCNGVSGRWLNKVLSDGAPRATAAAALWNPEEDDLKDVPSNAYVRATEILASILQIKKGCPRPGKDLVKASVQKTTVSLTTVRPAKTPVSLLRWADLNEQCPIDLSIELNRASATAELKRTVRELFAGAKYTWRDRLRPIFPSTSSSNEATRAEGGSFSSIRKVAEAVGLTSYTDDQPVGPSNVRHSVVIADVEEGIGAAQHVVYEADVTQLERRFGTLYLSALKLAEQESPLAIPVGLAESLKVRVITKGPPASSFILKPLQKFLWEQLSRHRTFELIGTPVTDRIVAKAMGARLPPGEAYLSGDYSDATNELAPWVSEAIVDELCLVLGLPASEARIFKSALTGHVIGENHAGARPQLWGQLMGSVVSFPVLCIANAALCRWAIEVAQQRKRLLRDCALLINGDDCLFRTTEAGLKHWKTITSFCGLNPSVGKFFFTRDFAQINSVNFRRSQVPHYDVNPDGSRSLRLLECTKFVNLGLLLGLKRSGEQVGSEAIADSRSGLGTRCRELLAAAPPDLSPILLKAFVDHHRPILDKSKITPWFLPESWGGVGLPLVRAPRTGPQPDDIDDYLRTAPSFLYGGLSDLDRRIAARIKESPLKFPVGRLPAESQWDVHGAISSRLPAAPAVFECPVARSLVTGYSRVYGLLAVDAMLTVRDLMKDSDSTRLHRVLRRNERSFAAVVKLGKLPPPLSVATILSEAPGKPFLPYRIKSVNDSMGARA